MTPEQPHPAGRVLVLDDNSVSRHKLARYVAQQGHQVHIAGDGREALARLAAEAFDLVLLDLDMPDLSGDAVLQQMKSDARLRDIPVIMVSGVDEIQSVVRCIEMGAEDYLPKPFDPVLLRARLGASLEKKRLRDDERRRTEELARALRELEETRDRLIVQEKMASLGTLTAGIAHEIKNPLNFITNFAQLARDLLGEARQELEAGGERTVASVLPVVGDLLKTVEENLAIIDEQGRRADAIVRGMLLHAHSKSGERQPTDLNALLDQTVNLVYHGLRVQDPGFAVTVEKDYDPALGPVSIVPQDMNRVFVNLLNNACHAARQKKAANPSHTPRLIIATRARDAWVEVSIRDNGDGVPPALRDRIFQPFFTTKPPGTGTGLGLSISYDLVVRGHQGEILLDSQEGAYAQFTVRLPKGPAA